MFIFAGRSNELSGVTKKNLIELLEAVGNISTDGYVLYNLKISKLEYINQSMVDLFDISHKSFTHQAEFFVNHVAENDLELLRAQYDTLLKEKRVENIEFSTVGHGGNVRNVSASAYCLFNEKYIIGIFRDISRSREHENYIINYGAKKNTLLDMVTHNLSGPLAIAKNLVESLENVVSVNDLKNVHAHVQLIKENTGHCIELVNEFLEEEHLVSQNIAVKKNRVEVLNKINTIIERFRKGHPDFKFTVTGNVDSLNASLDDVKFLQLMNNLISNAVKWSQTKQEIEIRITDEGDAFSVSVRDSGVGIPEHLQRFIFDRNSRASRPGLRGEKSIGMGLYIVKRLARLMDGDISFESEEGRGSTFTLRMPKDDLTEDGERPGAHRGSFASNS
jgi:two-component system, OmpR family, sensor histidine kinase VicK